jgi:hypothetical protein
MDSNGEARSSTAALDVVTKILSLILVLLGSYSSTQQVDVNLIITVE